MSKTTPFRAPRPKSDSALVLDAIYREHGTAIRACLIRMVKDWDLAEECMQEAFAAAIEQWPDGERPDNARAWLIKTAHHKAIDRIRRNVRFEEKRAALLREIVVEEGEPEEPSSIVDDRLRLIFTCCHPAIARPAQVALTLRTLCGLTTEEIARAFLVPPTTMAQRLVRAKRKILTARIPYRVPTGEHLPERLNSVLAVIYLVFNEGYARTSGDDVASTELCHEAIRLGSLMCSLMERESEPKSLLALMLLHDARRESREKEGELILLEDQDRTRWNTGQIDEGLALVDRALRLGHVGPYGLQAAIAALHARAKTAEDTDWKQIAALYALLLDMSPTPVVALNRAVAVAMAEGVERGLSLIDELQAEGSLVGYHLLPAARADLLRRLGRLDEAAQAYDLALTWVENDVERRFLQRRRRSLPASLGPDDKASE